MKGAKTRKKKIIVSVNNNESTKHHAFQDTPIETVKAIVNDWKPNGLRP